MTLSSSQTILTVDDYHEMMTMTTTTTTAVITVPTGQDQEDSFLQNGITSSPNGETSQAAGANNHKKQKKKKKKTLENIISGVSSHNNNKDTIPPPFICPITHQLLLDPVVGPDGISYERSILLVEQQFPEGLIPTTDIATNISSTTHSPDDDTTNDNNNSINNNNNSTVNHPMPSDGGLQLHEVYPNRVLRRIMEECLGLTEDTWEDGIRRVRNQVISSSSSVEGDEGWMKVFSLPHDQPIPESYICPITLDLFLYPVIDPEGNTYEQSAIIPWIQTHGVSPLSRTPMSIHDLYPNYAIRKLMEYHASEDANANDDDEEEEEEEIHVMDEEEGREGDVLSVTDDDYDVDDEMIKVRKHKIHPGLVKWKAEIASTVGTEWPPLESNLNNNNNNTNHDVTAMAENIAQSLYHQYFQQQLMTLPPHVYPMTMEDLELYRRHQQWILRRAALCTALSFVGFVAAVYMVIENKTWTFVSVWLGLLAWDCFRRYRSLRSEQNSLFASAEERIRASHLRADQLRARLAALRSLMDGEEQQQQQEGGGQVPTQPTQPTQPSSSANESNTVDIETGGSSTVVGGEGEATVLSEQSEASNNNNNTVTNGPIPPPSSSSATTTAVDAVPSSQVDAIHSMFLARELQQQVHAEEAALARRRHQARVNEVRRRHLERVASLQLRGEV